MNEFEWRRQLRELDAPVAPRRDLWSDVEAALASPPAATRRASTRPVWLLAASFAGLSLFAVGLTLRQSQLLDHARTSSVAATHAVWRPDDPRLAGAAIELDAANLELKQALEQAPHSSALRRLLSRTRQQQSRLRQLDQQAG